MSQEQATASPPQVVKFRCGQCRQKIGTSVNNAGIFVRCPNCGKPAMVPVPEGVVIDEQTIEQRRLEQIERAKSAAKGGGGEGQPATVLPADQPAPAPVAAGESSTQQDTDTTEQTRFAGASPQQPAPSLPAAKVEPQPAEPSDAADEDEGDDEDALAALADLAGAFDDPDDR